LTGASAMPFMNWNLPSNVAPNASASISRTRVSYVRMDGVITAWGSKTVIGSIQAQSQTTVLSNSVIRQGFSSTAIWTTNSSSPIAAVKARENFTYTFYSARLISGNYSALDYKGFSFFMNGTWNAWNITETFTIKTNSSGYITSINSNQNIVQLVSEAYGELTVDSGWSTFSLAITGIDPLTGTVYAHVTASRSFNPFVIDIGVGSTTVTPTDLKNVASAYGSMPGWGNYDQRMDYALHYRIDLCDLATAAANLNSSQ